MLAEPHGEAFSVPILGVQPSQFYVCRGKLMRVMEGLDLSAPDPLPVKTLRGITLLTDGHTRALAHFRAGAKTLWVVNDDDDLDWDAYLACVSECRRRGVRSIADLDGRVLSDEEYEAHWLAWCTRLHEQLDARRNAK